MNIILAIVLIVVALAGGTALGVFISRQGIKKQMPAIYENVMREVLKGTGQKVTEAKFRQMMNALKKQMK
ncbi:MAG: YneF family protein [Lactobacillales bacterium]|jgi:uncharacterized protein YneF (UPF0154 family)|nr:YneF family protein [Lactobacillales bacterium]